MDCPVSGMKDHIEEWKLLAVACFQDMKQSDNLYYFSFKKRIKVSR